MSGASGASLMIAADVLEAALGNAGGGAAAGGGGPYHAVLPWLTGPGAFPLIHLAPHLQPQRTWLALAGCARPAAACCPAVGGAGTRVRG